LPTEKLYYQDAYLKQFEAQVIKKTALSGGKFAIVLDRTAFYPEGGGQPCDLGTLGGVPVIDVRTINDEIVHTTEGDPGEGTLVGRLDWQRRFDHMQQHSGEHILSGILLANYQAENVGFHLSASTCQIDVTLPALTPEQAAEIEDAANAVIFANLLVDGRFVEQADLATYSLRKEPGKEFAQIRLVSVQDCDCCPCGGTHVARTGDVGLFKLRGWEKRKSNIRLDFVCGGRTLADYRLKHDITRALSTRFSTPVEGILPAVERTLEKLDAVQALLSATRKTYHEELAARLLAEAGNANGPATSLISRVFANYTASDLQDFASRISSAGGICLLAATDSETGRTSLLFAAAANPPLPMNELLKQTLAPFGGKGGGNALSAQGGLQGGDAESILAEARGLLESKA
jgi:alanyl-tRNA synthetase